MYLVLTVVSLSSSVPSSPCGVSVVLVGSTGDLARRYLWPAIFHHYKERHCPPSSLPSSPPHQPARGCGLTVVGGSREEPLRGEEGWGDLLGGVRCETISCELCLSTFKNSTLRMKISDEADYNAVSTTLSGVYQILNQTEVGRLFYLSVPPSAYPGIVRHIHKHGRPRKGVWLRVVLEKPFGSDLPSAEALTGELTKHLDEDAVYRVDHYLGKPGVQQILPFRRANSAKLRPLWRGENIQHVEIAMKERLDVRGRSRFFNEYGIIKDVHQNHLTEILLRILADPGGSNFQTRKIDVLKQIFSPMLRQSILGQYAGYHSHLSQDGVQSSFSGSVPTFAAVLLYSRDPRWQGVPFLLTAGKKLDERKAFARVVFKQWRFSLTDRNLSSCPAEILFLIQDEELRRPGVLVSEHFFGMGLGYGDWEWTQVEIGSCFYGFLSSLESASSNAYVAVLGDVLAGRRESFVDTASLLASWEVWNPLLNEINSSANLKLIQYSPEDLSLLNFHIQERRLVPESEPALKSNVTRLMFDSSTDEGEPCDVVLSPSGVACVVGTEQQVISCLAKELLKSASASVRERGTFHLALPGGRSPQPLFNLLSLEYTEAFPWIHTHIWQTDERCVPSNHSDSNWNQIQNLLLSQIRIPYHHLHPMPVSLHGGVCMPEDRGCGLYASQLLESIGSLSLDHVVLGVGRDGHTASIFPESSLSDDDAILAASATGRPWVRMVQLKETAPSAVKLRMSLSLQSILLARRVSVVLVGGGKEGIVERVMTGGGGEEEEGGGGGAGEDDDMPILRLLKNSRKDQVTVYTAT